MTQIITATFDNGLLKPDEPLNLPPKARVRLVIDPLEEVELLKEKEWEEFDRFCEENSVDSGGIRMTRDQLHERH